MSGPVGFAPVIGWLVRCASCGARGPGLRPACEIAGLAVPVSSWAASPDLETFLFSCALGWLLLALAAIDSVSRRLPNALNLAVALLGAAMVLVMRQEAWLYHLIGGAAGFLLLFAVEHGYRLLRKRDGVGRGDAKLLGAIGVWVGWAALPSVLLVASLSGLAFALAAARLLGREIKSHTSVAFGPWLALAGWAVWLTLNLNR